MKNARAHVRKLAKLIVCYNVDYLGIVYNAGICHKESGNVCPVLI